MRSILLLFMISVATLFLQQANAQCCTIIDMARDNGTFTIRDKSSGRIQSFKPDALEGAELKVGDTVDAKFDLMQTISVKGVAKTYNLLEPVYGDSCCIITKFDLVLPDSVLRITAKNISSGQHIYFDIPAMLRSTLDSGATVFTQTSHGYAMVTNRVDSTRRKVFGFPLLEKNPE